MGRVFHMGFNPPERVRIARRRSVGSSQRDRLGHPEAADWPAGNPTCPPSPVEAGQGGNLGRSPHQWPADTGRRSGGRCRLGFRSFRRNNGREGAGRTTRRRLGDHQRSMDGTAPYPHGQTLLFAKRSVFAEASSTAEDSDLGRWLLAQARANETCRPMGRNMSPGGKRSVVSRRLEANRGVYRPAEGWEQRF